MATIIGTNFNDNDTVNGLPLQFRAALTGFASNDLIQGLDGHDELYGEGGRDTLEGGQGSDTLDGGTGNDRMLGGTEDDLYYVDNTGDRVIENANEGTDKVISSVDFTLSDHVENLRLTGAALLGTGNVLDNIMTGNANNNTLDGGAGNDTLDGGSGADTMIGGIGNDVYYVSSPFDVVTENPNEGIDAIVSTGSLSLPDNVENLDLVGSFGISGTGNNLDNILTGNEINNILNGEGGADLLYGMDGSDTLNGGAGNDTLIGGAGSDDLLGGGGSDRLTGYGGLGSFGGLGFPSLEFDTLNGGTASNVLDTYVLGDASGLFYTRSLSVFGGGIIDEYATIVNWEPGIDKIEISGTSTDYTLVGSAPAGGGPLDTQIFQGTNLIAVVQGSTDVLLSRDFVFV